MEGEGERRHAVPGGPAHHGLNDPRVAVWQPAKMAARLQAATSSGRPVLLRVDAHAGHGHCSTRSQRDALVADVFAFLLHAFAA